MTPDSVSDKVAQLIFARIGSNMRPSVTVSEDVERVAVLLRSCPVGGLVVFNGRADSTPDELSGLQHQSRYPLLIAADIERGLGQQFLGATVFPHAMAFDALGEAADDAIEQVAFFTASEALSAGVHISFSPVADVHSNPDNPIISIRSFGSKPEVVSRRVASYVRGCRRAGLLTTAKHFPGHGDTDSDSHDALPIVDKSRKDLSEVELPPFSAAIRSGVDLIMTAHVAYPSLDPTGNPATRSAPILNQLLRTDLGFDGAVITDSLLMEGADSRGNLWAAEMIQAGADILLDVENPVQVHADLLQALSSGFLTERRIDEAFERVWRLKTHFLERFGTSFFTHPGKSYPRTLIGADDHRQKAHEIAYGAVRIFNRSTKNDLAGMDCGLGDGLLFILVRPHVTYSDPTAGSLAEPVTAAFDPVEFVEIRPDCSAGYLASLVASAPRYGAVVIAAAIKPAAWHRFGLLPEQRQFVADVSAKCPIILAAMGSPRLLDEFPDVPVGICTYSDVAVSQQALVDRLVDLFNRKEQV